MNWETAFKLKLKLELKLKLKHYAVNPQPRRLYSLSFSEISITNYKHTANNINAIAFVLSNWDDSREREMRIWIRLNQAMATTKPAGAIDRLNLGFCHSWDWPRLTRLPLWVTKLNLNLNLCCLTLAAWLERNIESHQASKLHLFAPARPTLRAINSKQSTLSFSGASNNIQNLTLNFQLPTSKLQQAIATQCSPPLR